MITKVRSTNKNKQISLLKTDWKNSLSYGGSLRQRRKGRQRRPLSCSDPLHVVFKVNRHLIWTKSLRSHQNFKLVTQILERYARRVFIKIEQVSIQADHIHCLVRTSRRSQFHYFFRVVAGQIAQQFQNTKRIRPAVTGTPKRGPARGKGGGNGEGRARKDKVSETQNGEGSLKLWRHRPFSRVVKGWKAYQIVRNYIQLNEKEAFGEIAYKKDRLRGLSISEWNILWS